MHRYLWLPVALLGLMGFCSLVDAAPVRTDCGRAVSCWHASDATADFVAYGTPDSDAQPLRLSASPSGPLRLMAFLPQQPGERIAEGKRVQVKVSGRGWSRILEGRAFCKDGCNFQASIGRDHPLLTALVAGETVRFSRRGQSYAVSGEGAKPVIGALLARRR